MKEVFRMEGFWSELRKKMVFGLIQAGGDFGIKIAAWQYIYGATASPAEYGKNSSLII
jgi:hypothetical protein